MLSYKQKFELLYRTCAIATRKILVVQLRGEHYHDETRTPDYRKMYCDLYQETTYIRQMLTSALLETRIKRTIYEPARREMVLFSCAATKSCKK